MPAQRELTMRQTRQILRLRHEGVGAIAFQNKAAVYAILFRAAADTLRVIAADPRHLGAEIGGLAVLHSWGHALISVPSTEKCSSDSSGATSRWARMAARNLRDMSVVSSRSRFLVNTVGLRPGAPPVQG